MPATPVDILVVDDELPLRVSLGELLTQTGHDVRSAPDGFSALRELGQKVPDILLSDLNMPGTSGFELLSVVRRRFPQIRVIATSGSYTGEGVPDGVAADAFYQKGTGIHSLLRIVQAMTCQEQEITLRSVVGPTPIWIAGNGHRPSGMPYVTITCPECLRTFPQLLESAVVLIQDAVCIFCSTLIRYAVDLPPDTRSREDIPSEVHSEVSPDSTAKGPNPGYRP